MTDTVPLHTDDNSPGPVPMPALAPWEQSHPALSLATRPRIALAHDWLCGLRGGEYVLDAIIRCLRPHCDIAGLFVMFNDGRGLTPAIDAIPTVVSNVGRWPLASTRLRRELLPLYPKAVENLSAQLAALHRRSKIDLVISTSSAAIKGLKSPTGVPHICYIHAPARYVWSLEDAYARGSLLRRVGLRTFGPGFREWDKQTASNVTQFIANSTYTAAEVLRCYGAQASVVFPPVRTDFFTLPDTGAVRDGSWLVVSALEPYKRIDLAIAAANARGHPLTIIGGGSQLATLKQQAGPTVTFANRVTDDIVRMHYRRASLLVFPQLEDFGIVACEAQACGLPVVAFGKGGAVDTVINGKTGALFGEQTTLSLLEAIDRCPTRADEACRENALRFSEETFMRGILASLDAYMK